MNSNFLTPIFLTVSILIASFATTGHANAQEQIELKFVDSKNSPVENVKAYRFADGKAKRISTQNGSAKIPANNGLVVGKKEGFQFSGILLDEKSKEATVVMLKSDESGTKFTTRPVPISAESKPKIIEKIEEHFWKELQSAGNDPSKLQRCIKVLSRLAPHKTLEYFEANPVRGQIAGLEKQELIKALAQSDFEAAAEIANSIDDPMKRAVVLTALLKNAKTDNETLSAIETEMASTIKDIPQPMLRFAMWSSLAEHYRITERPALAQKIVDEHIEDVKKLPAGGWSGYPRSLFGALVVENDAELATELVKGMDKNESSRALGRLAFHCCRTNPDQAIEFLKQSEDPENKLGLARNHVKVCHRMAIEQTEKAFELAGSLDEPNQKAWAYGLMADRLHATNPKRAKEAIDLAIETMASSGTEDDAWYSTASTTAGLLQFAEKVAPEKMQTIIWQSVYLSLPRSRWNAGGASKAEKRQSAAAAIARYDIAIAKRLAGDSKMEIGSDVTRAATNQVALDPEGLPEFLERLNDVRHSGAFHPRAVAAELLTGSDEAFWMIVSKPSLLEWPTERFEEQ